MKCLKYIFWAFLAVVVSLSSFAQDVFEKRFDLQKLDPNEAQQRIAAFRNYRYKGDYSLKFHLVHMPRRGAVQLYVGTLWGSWNDKGHPLTRFELRPLKNVGLGQKSKRYIVQNGPAPKIWSLEEGGKIQELDQKDWFNPIFENTVYTAFDLSLAFLFWDKFEYVGPQHVKGRPAQIFTMYPPDEFAKDHPDLKGIRIAMDASYNFLVQADLLNCEENPIKSIKLNEFKRVDDEYIIRELDVVDDFTHDKTRFEVNSAAMNQKIPSNFFLPQSLNSENPKITSYQ